MNPLSRRPQPSATLSRRSLALLTVGALGATTLGACSSKQPGGADDGPVHVFASTSVWASIAKNVGGDLVEVFTPIAKADMNPHEYEASASDKLKASQAKVAVINGGGYDTWAEQLIESTRTQPSVVDAFDEGNFAEGDNEHVFYSLAAAQATASATAKALAEASPENKDAFTKNAETFTAKIQELRDRCKAWSTKNPSAKVVSTESVAEYLVADLGLEDATPPEYIRQSESESGASVAVIEKTLRTLGSEARILLVNGQTEDAVSKKLVDRAKQTDSRIVKVYETFPEGTTDYIAFMNEAISAITG